jgi:hypothetical protein
MNATYSILVFQPWSPVNTLNVITAGHAFLGVSVLFLLKFLGKVLLIFAGSATISKLLKLDKAYDHLHDHQNA